MLEAPFRTSTVVNHPANPKGIYVPETPTFLVPYVLLFVVSPRNIVPEPVVGHRNPIVLLVLRIVTIPYIVGMVPSKSIPVPVDGIGGPVPENVGIRTVVFVLRIAAVEVQGVGVQGRG